MAIKISQKILWIRDYLKDVERTLPKMKYLTHVSARTPNVGRIQHSYAHIIEDSDTRKYKIVLNLCYFTLESTRAIKRKKNYFSKIDLLVHLAHELAHLYHWKHTPQHKILEADIVKVFMRRLKKEGYISEEHEDIQRNFKELQGAQTKNQKKFKIEQ